VERSPRANDATVSWGRAKLISTEDSVPLANVSEKRVKGASNLDNAQFLNRNDGWVASKKSLFRTSNAGESWDRIALSIPDTSYISYLFFMNPERGWLAVVNKANLERFGVGYSSKILSTTDGGSNWIEQSIFKDEVEIRSLKFVNSNEGFAIGSKVVGSNPPYPELFIARTTDGGNTWRDVSDRVNLAIRDEFGKSNDYGADLHWITSTRLFLLTGLGRILSTSNSGETWSLISKFQDSRSQTGYQRLVSDNNEAIHVIAGTISNEGIWGSLLNRDQDSSWANLELPGIFVFDALFPAGSEVVACGGQYQELGGSNPTYSGRALPGVILHSRDGGETWAIVYRLKVNQPFVYVIQIEGNRFYAIGSDGTFLKFDL
jgi:photosystem II stability/assembly factor-like uncharacterized protein